MMKNLLEFSLPRFLLTIKHDFSKNWKRILTVVGAGFLVITLFILFLFAANDDIHFLRFEAHSAFYPLLLIFLGSVLVTSSFRDLRTDAERINYLSIPSSHLEKFLSKVFLYGLALPVFISIVYCIYAFLYDSYMISSYGSGDGFKRFDFFSNKFIYHGPPTGWQFLKIYLSVQSIAFLGAITFRKYNLVKTIFSTFFITLLVNGIVYFLMKIFLPELFTGWSIIDDNVTVRTNEYFSDCMRDGPFLDIFYFLGVVVVPLIIMVAAFFKLTEKEA